MASSDVLFESAGHLPAFSLGGVDLEASPDMLERVAAQVAYRGEVILVCGDAKPTASSANGLNTIMQLRALRLHHVLYLSDSAASCAALRGALPDVACVWSSRINASKPSNGGLCVQLYWGYAFYFYDLRKHYIARMTIELGLNVLQTDTDVVWLANPYPALKQVFGGQQIIGMSDRPMINAGVFYAQNVREGDGASWVLRELARRIHTFLLRPSAVRDYVPWAQPPFFANVDEQTLMNDCVRSSIANVVSFAQATAGWEVKRHRTGTVMNKSFSWKKTAEYRLVRWLDRVVPAASHNAPLPALVRVREVCSAPKARSAGAVFPLHAVGSKAPARATLTIAPPWLFMHLPSSHASGAIRHCRNASAAAHPTAAPFIMGHLAGVRTGSWSRRALVRSYGWWHPAADRLIARQLGWGRSPRALTLVGGTSALVVVGEVVRSQSQLDMLVANMLVLGGLLNRRVVVPEVPCGLFAATSPRRGYGTRPVAARVEPGPQTCAWMPPKACWAVEYTTLLEFEREAAASPLLVPQGSSRRAARLAADGSACDDAARQMAHTLTPAGLRITATAATSATAAAPRNVSIVALRRRLRELPCDTSPTISLLHPMHAPTPVPTAAHTNDGATPNGSRTATRVRHRTQLLELLVRTPLLNHPSRQQLLLPKAFFWSRLQPSLECIRTLYSTGIGS